MLNAVLLTVICWFVWMLYVPDHSFSHVGTICRLTRMNQYYYKAADQCIYFVYTIFREVYTLNWNSRSWPLAFYNKIIYIVHQNIIYKIHMF